MKEIRINTRDQNIYSTYTDAVAGKTRNNLNEKTDDYTADDSITTKLKQDKDMDSIESNEDMTQATSNTIQMKLIKELQASVKMLQASQ